MKFVVNMLLLLTSFSVAGGQSPTPGDPWIATSAIAAPTGRIRHSALWTGNEMIVWGGADATGYLNTGGGYDPTTDAWRPLTTTNAPTPRGFHTAVWTGSEMIIWGGIDNSLNVQNSGGIYNPTTDVWRPISTTNAPNPRYVHTAVWTGNQMIVWGGLSGAGQLDTGGKYDPSTDTWSPVSSTNAPSARQFHTAIWTGSEMVVWGGWGGGTLYFNDGGRYDPAADHWTAINTANAPSPRVRQTAIWTGSEMVIWGGADDNSANFFNTGGRYTPATNIWAPTSTSNAPTGRITHTAVWTGTQMIVWGGYYLDATSQTVYVNTGGRYNPSTDTWAATPSLTNAPRARAFHTALWAGNRMIVWGGNDQPNYFGSGGKYDPLAPWISIARSGFNLAVEFNGVLQQSVDLSQWSDLDPQPLTPWTFAPSTGKMFFRAQVKK
jgi:N-acetylneuraminic acid mutarotase